MEKSKFATEYDVLRRLLHEKRTVAQLTQIDLAKRLKETQSYVSKVERGDRRLDLIQLRQFCKAMGISFVEFVREFDALTSHRKR